ncbi:MAG: tetratricopeptide repeat protein [Kiritimatiellae bacterium]|nr:tetratricopeptide repeat protein [Kiritimatiellia bacterium]
MSRVRPHFVIALLLVAVTALVYRDVADCGFVQYDDPPHVSENPHVRAGFTAAGVGWALRSPPPFLWHPLTWFSYMLDRELYADAPGGYHLTNLLLHQANTLLLFLLLARLTGRVWRAAFVAAVFAVHPLHVESVAWISQRKDVLSTLLLLLTLAAYARYVRRPSPWRYAPVLLLFLLGLAAKPMLVTVPFVLLLLDYWPLNRFKGVGRRFADALGRPHRIGIPRLCVAEKIPLLVLALAAAGVTLLTHWRTASVTPMLRVPLAARLAYVPVSYVTYIWKTLCPYGLAVFYPHPGAAVPARHALGAAALLVVVSGLVLWRGRRQPYLPFGWFWFLGTLVPVIGLVQIGEHGIADRYMYVPMIGLTLAATWGVADLAAGWPLKRWVLATAGGLLVAVFGVLACVQVDCWRSSIALFLQALEATPRNYVACNNLGIALADQGRLDEAIPLFQASLRMRPANERALVNLGVAHFRKGELELAVAHYSLALDVNPNNYRAHADLGAAFVRRLEPEQALAHYSHALRIRPGGQQARDGLRSALKLSELANRTGGAPLDVLTVKPGDAEAPFRVGRYMARHGKFREAAEQFSQALAVRPGFAAAHDKLGLALKSLGEDARAERHYREAIRLQPDYAQAYNNLGSLLAGREEYGAAINLFAEAVRLDSDFAEAHNNLGLALAKRGQIDKAIEHFSAALRIRPDFEKARRCLDMALEQKGRQPP